MFYRNRAEQFSIAVPYIQIGLERRERCLYIADDNSPRAIIAALEEAGVDTSAAISRGALTITTKHDTYLHCGEFDPQQMIANLDKEVRQALAKGYAGLRGTGEMTWALTLPAALARLNEYESELEVSFPEKFIGLCQYNENGFEPAMISDVLRTHAKVIARGRLFENPHYISNLHAAARMEAGAFSRVTLDELINCTAVRA
jgi:hypothetical protein